MKAPESLIPLMEQGLLQEVIRPLRSGKEAQIYLVRVGDEERVAKVYKESTNRSFKHRSQYTEGRTVRNSRDQRAMRKQSNYGKKRDESEWRSTEADIIFRLHSADVKVPEPFDFVENVLIMALVRDEHGKPAPRLADINPSPAEAKVIFEALLADTVRMLCAGVVHGDLSEFNVLMSGDGPVIIDFPQAVDPAKNRNAKTLLMRDIANIERVVSRHSRRRHHSRYGQEMWGLFEKQMLSPDTRLTGRASKVNDRGGESILAEMEAMDRAARERRAALGLPPPRARAAVFRNETPAKPAAAIQKPSSGKRKRSRRRKPRDGAQAATATPGANKPAANKPTANKPASSGPASSRPASSRPASNRPTSSKPASSRPASSKPGANKPTANKPQAGESNYATPSRSSRRRRRRRGPPKSADS